MFSRFAGLNSVKRIVGRSLCTRNNIPVYSCIQRPQACLNNSTLRSTLPVSCRYYGVEAAAAPALRENRSKPVAVSVAKGSLDDLLYRLDSSARRYGRIDQEDVISLIKLVSNTKNITKLQGTLILRCTGALLTKESPAERNAIFNKACEALHKAGVEFDVQMYNAMLRVKLENRQAFSPVDMLSEIEVTKQLVPNRVTYQLLISQFCEVGDIQGASKILDHMKTQNLPLNESVFNALVKGYTRKGDVSGAREVMTSMKAVGLDPTADTYSTLMSFFAEKGDMPSIKQTIAEAASADASVAPRHVFNTVVTLAESGQHQHISQMLDYIRQRGFSRYNQDAVNCMFQLIAGGHDDAAFDVFMTIDNSNYLGEEGTVTNILIRTMIMKGRPIEKVFEVVEKLKSEKFPMDRSLEQLPVWSYIYQDAGYALKVLKHLKSLGVELKQQDFWPVLKKAAQKNDVDGVAEGVRQLIACSGDSVAVMGAVNRWAVTELLARQHKLDDILDKLKVTGMSAENLQALRVSSLIFLGKFDDAAKLIEEGHKFSPGLMKTMMDDGFAKNQSIDGVNKVLLAAKKQFGSADLSDVYSNVFIELMKSGKLTHDALGKIADSWTENGLRFKRMYHNVIVAELKARDCTPDLIQKFEKLFVDDVKKSAFAVSQKEIDSASVDQLKAWLEKAQEAKAFPLVSRLEKNLLRSYCMKEMVQEVDVLKTKMSERGFVFSADLLYRVGVITARNKRQLVEAQTYKQEIENRFPSYRDHTNLVLYIAELQLCEGKYNDAIATMKDHFSQLAPSSQPTLATNCRAACQKLVESSSSHGSIEQTLALVDLLHDNGFIAKGSFFVLNKLVDSYIKKDDADGVIKIFEHCVTKFQKAASFGDVFEFFIRKEDADRLQKAVDLATTVYGEMDILLRLAACFVECDKVRQARKIMETPGIRAQPRTLAWICEHFITKDKGKELEQFVEITKNLFAADRAEMLFQLIRLHAKHNDSKKMLEVLSVFEEESLMVKPNMLVYMAKVLKALGQPVPFQVPELPSKESQEKPKSKAVSSSADTLPQGDEKSKPKAPAKDNKKEQKQVDAPSKAPKVAAVSHIDRLKMLLEKPDYTRRVGRYLSDIAHLGDVSGLTEIEKSGILEGHCKSLLHRSLFLGHIFRNTAEDVIKSWETNTADMCKHVSRQSLLELRKQKPDQLERLERLITTHLERGFDEQVAIILHDYYISSGQLKKTEEVLTKFPELRNKVNVLKTCRLASMQPSLETQDQFYELFIKTFGAENADKLTVPYNFRLQLKCKQNAWDAVVDCYNAAAKHGVSIEKLWISTARAVMKSAETNGQKVPWPAEVFEKKLAEQEKNRKDRQAQRRQKNESSSSSSDSD